MEAVDTEGEYVDMLILTFVEMMNGNLQSPMERLLKLFHLIVLNKTSGSIYLSMYAID